MCKIRDKIEKKYAIIGVDKALKTQGYINNIYLYDKNSAKARQLNFNHTWHNKQSYIYFTQRINKLQQEMIKKDYVPLFITLTLPSKFHKYRTLYLDKKGKNKKIIKNKGYGGLTIEDGYKQLNKWFKFLYNKFKDGRKNVKGIKFIKVIEPHYSYTPHLHAIVYVPKQYLEKYLEFYSNFIEREGIKEHKIVTLKQDKYSIVYLIKYIKKTLDGVNFYLDGWRKDNNIHRLFSISNVGITRDVFKVLTKYIDFNEKSKYNYIDQCLEKAQIIEQVYEPKNDNSYQNYAKYDKEKLLADNNLQVVQVKRYGNEDGNFTLYVKRLKYDLRQKVGVNKIRNYDYMEYDNVNDEYFFMELSDIEDEENIYDYEHHKILISMRLVDKDGYEIYNSNDYRFGIN